MVNLALFTLCLFVLLSAYSSKKREFCHTKVPGFPHKRAKPESHRDGNPISELIVAPAEPRDARGPSAWRGAHGTEHNYTLSRYTKLRLFVNVTHNSWSRIYRYVTVYIYIDAVATRKFHPYVWSYIYREVK